MMRNFENISSVSSLERKLSESLRPIRPDPVFVHSLREKLSQGSGVMVEKQASHQGIMLIGLGLLTGAIIIWLMRRFNN